MLQFEIKWTISKAPSTYGYNICTIRGQNRAYKAVKVSCKGAGFNMFDACLGELLEKVYPEFFDGSIQYTDDQLKSAYRLSKRDDGSYYYDGGCGTIDKIARDLFKLTITYIHSYTKDGKIKDTIGIVITEIEKKD